jgi:putative copper export protein
MTSDSDELEQQLRQNLQLRRKLAAEVAKAKDNSASQRVSRGFYWLGILLAAVLIVAGIALMVAWLGGHLI